MSKFAETMLMLNQHFRNGSRTDVLRPVAWLVTILLGGAIGLQHVGAPSWTMAALIVLLFAIVLMYAGAYIYCLLTNPDALRSEKFAIEKLAIEKGVYGDDRVGIVDITPTEAGAVALEDSRSEQ